MTTTYFLNCMAGNVFGTKTSPAIPSTYYLGLSTTAPNVDGSNVTEPTDTAYTRCELTSLSEPSDGMVQNEESVEFPDSTANWGTVTHFVVYDAQTGGNLLLYGQLNKSRVIQEDSHVSFGVNQLKLTLKNPTT